MAPPLRSAPTRSRCRRARYRRCRVSAQTIVRQQRVQSRGPVATAPPLASRRRDTSSTIASESSPDSISGVSASISSELAAARASRSTSTSSASAPTTSRSANGRPLLASRVPAPFGAAPLDLAPSAMAMLAAVPTLSFVSAPLTPSAAAGATRCGNSAESSASMLARNGYGSRRSGDGACGASMSCMASHSCSFCARYSSGRIAAWKEAATSCNTHYDSAAAAGSAAASAAAPENASLAVKVSMGTSGSGAASTTPIRSGFCQ
eukprot:scaffold14468_cov64-Phaeocystis_antarctica.AAC.1